ncbi:probable enoyl-CoA hydratase echA8 [Zeugodacus cucurbitae]|uniref:3-hydroxypropionyl-coenzyme A dehydratase n=1 Tax=Zeugodacus cucurbitae TaxID=28588 RepID=A0A0A1WVA2_ZEUCU|nr:probable enoyl-CoA hydratase echA8 [Zeugodacus cucurbitae]XP_054088709.1 probable enoyl-CoA hydratase echA8 [Zeugodacus cucurbitae]
MANVLNRYGLTTLHRLMIKRCLRRRQKVSTKAIGSDIVAESSVLVDKDDHITLIGLNRPDNRNSINADTAKRLSEALTDFENDRTSPVAVIYGIGGSFCAGQDLTMLDSNSNSKENLSALSTYKTIHRHSQKPIVCGINGYCVGDGLELAMFCDLRVMENTAVLGFFGRFTGYSISCGGIARLPAMIGYSRSLDLVLTGRRVSGKEALQMGLVNRLVATGTALGQAVNLAFSIAKFPLEALQKDRQAVYKNCYERRKGLSAAITEETTSINNSILSEIKEGIARLKEGKTDSWQVKPKVIPAWEQEEILHEQKFASNENIIDIKS